MMRTLRFSLVAVVLCSLLYWPGLSGPFLFDDTHTVAKNPWIQIDNLGKDSLFKAAESFAAGGRELAMLSFAVNHYFLGHAPFAYKAVNLAVHATTGLLLFLLTRLLVARLVPTVARQQNAIFRWAPEAIALLWLVSPINLTSVLYISQRMTSLAGLFVVLGILLYVVARIRQLDGRGASWLTYPGIFLCLTAAWLSKENGLLLLPLLLLVEVVVFSFSKRDGGTGWIMVLVVAAVVIAGMLAFGASVNFDLSGYLSAYRIRSFTLEERVMTQARLLIFYIGLVLFPLAGRFGLWHDDIEISTALTAPPDTLTSILLLALLLVIGMVVWRRYPLCSLGIGWFFIGHSMESTILPLEMVHEHRNYLPSYGVVLALVGFLGYLDRVRISLRIAVIGALIIAASYNLYARSLEWSGEYRLARYEFINHPTSPRATFEFAVANAGLVGAGFSEAEEATFALLEHATGLGDRTILPEVAMIVLGSQADRGYDREWIENAAEKLRVSGGLAADVMALRGMRECVVAKDCAIDPIDIRPLFEQAANSSSVLVVDEAVRFFGSIGDTEAAMTTLGRNARRSSNQDIRLNYIWSLIELGRIDEAREMLRVLDDSGVRILARNREALEAARQRLSASETEG